MGSWRGRVGALALSCAAGCGSMEIHKSISSLDFLYPAGTEALPAQEVKLQVPVRVALAFAPGAAHSRSSGDSTASQLFGAGGASGADPLTEVEKTAILERIASDLRGRDIVEGVDVIPSSYLMPGGSFANLDQIAHAFGTDVVILLSYDQAQFNNTTSWSMTYWTIVGAYLVSGEENETQTFLDAVVYDIPSRALLFRAAGTSKSGASATPVGMTAVLKEESRAGFNAATEALVAQLDVALGEFAKQATTGSVRGQGTPALNVSAAPEYKGVAEFKDGRYTGALGPEALLAGLLLLLGAVGARRAARTAG